MAERRSTLSESKSATDLAAPRTQGAELDLREHLPGVEPDRQVNDWGRSERIEGCVAKRVSEWLCRYWFRVEVEGIENVPSEVGALVFSNHAGALPPDAPMIA